MRYRTAVPLAHGGTADVFQAWDEEAGRPVALKFLRREDPDLVARLLREARAQARVDHPNVCKVYEVGERDGVPFIAMQLIEGETLDRAARGMTVEEKVAVMRAVAEGVHAAHRAGLVHRDLKPGNVMVERDETHGWVPYVLDFGLVWDAEASGATRTGTVLGTPAFMAPEQARGELSAIDRRTDVYGLGATFYAALLGRPPFEGQTATEILFKVLVEEPPPPRRVDPGLPKALENITLTCLAKDPERRYPSARALAEDLERYLDGQMVAARPVSWSYRLRRRARRHRAAVATAAVGLTVAMALGSWGLIQRWQAGRRAAVAQRFASEIRDVEWQLRVAQMSPLHDLTAERRRVEQRLAGIESAMADLGRPAEAAGHYALGRGRLALDQVDEAAPHLQRAWELGLRTPEAAFARGIALGRLYSRETVRARALRDEDLRQRSLDQAARSYRDPALEALSQARAAASAPQGYVEGLIAFYEERFEDALARAEEARRVTPWFWEALWLTGEVHRLRASQRFRENRPEEGEADLSAAEEAYRALSALAPSAPEGYEGRCALGNFRLFRSLYTGGGDEEVARVRQETVEACRLLEAVHPEHPDLPVDLANLHLMTARRLTDGRGDPTAEIEAGLVHARRAVELRPASGAALRALADLQLAAARAAHDRGEDSRELLELAASTYARALESEPSPSAASNSGNAWLLKAQQEMQRGFDPGDSFEEALRFYHRTLEMTPRDTLVHGNIALTLRYLAEWQGERGEDPRFRLEEAQAILEEQLEVDPNRSYLHEVLANTAVLRARAEWRRGHDPSLWLERGREAARRALEIDSGRHAAWSAMAAVEIEEVRQRGVAGAPLEPMWTAASTAVARHLVLRPHGAVGHRLEAELELALARGAAHRGSSPGPHLDRAEAALERASMQAHHDARRLLALRVEVLGLRCRTAPQAVARQAAHQALEMARRLDQEAPGAVVTLVAAGRAHLCAARWAQDASGADAHLTIAGERLRRGLAIDPTIERELAPELEELRDRLGVLPERKAA
jgi:eukaryotic-like serine/threonine-protein kinase